MEQENCPPSDPPILANRIWIEKKMVESFPALRVETVANE